MGVTQERVGAPSICTVQAPQSAIPQPNFVPVMPSTSRNTQSSGVSPSTSTLCALPLTLMVKAMVLSPALPSDRASNLVQAGFMPAINSRCRYPAGILTPKIGEPVLSLETQSV